MALHLVSGAGRRFSTSWRQIDRNGACVVAAVTLAPIVTVRQETHEGEGRVGPGPLVFVSYCREDAEWLRRFAVMLKPEVRGRGMQVWSDALIGTGRAWRPEIDDAIARADVALLLVSPDFLASDFIMDIELPALIDRGVPLVPVLLRACRHGAVPELMRVQWAHDPNADGPVADARDVDGAIVRVTDRLMALLDDRARTTHAATADPRTDFPPGGAGTPALTGSAGVGRLDGVPKPPLGGFVERPELAECRSALLAGGRDAVAITGSEGLGLYGQGGIGKTVLAAAIARDGEVRRHFSDGVYWMSLGEHPDLLGAQIDLLARLGVPAGELRTTLDGSKALERALADRRCLLVVDDVWTAAAAQAFAVVGAAGRVLYTTRDAATLRDVRAAVRRIDVLSDAAARQMLAGLTNTPADELPDDVDRVLEATGRVALALALIGAAVGRGGRDWQQVADELERAGETFLAHPYADVFKAMRVAVATLQPQLADAHETLAVYPEDARVPVVAVARLWARTHGASAEQARDWLRQLATRELITMEGDRIVLHDLQRDFLLLRIPSLRLLHHELLEAYRLLLPSPRSPWRELPKDEPYIVEHLMWHLVGAGDTRAATTTVTDLGYIAIRAFRDGPHAAERDARQAAGLAPADSAMLWVLDLLAQWGHALVGHDRLSDVAATLLTRTTTLAPGVDAEGLETLLPARALMPRWGLPDAHHALRRVLQGHSVWVNGVVVSTDGATLASASDDESVRLWDLRGGTQIALLEGHNGRVLSVAFSPDGARLASAGDDGVMRLWDLRGGTQTALLRGHDGVARAVAFSPDGATLASAGNDGSVRLWDVATATQTALLEGHGEEVNAVAFSPDGATLASAGDDRMVRLWDVAASTQTALLEGHDAWVRAVAFSPDGATLASAGNDGLVRLWDVAAATQTALLEGHNDWLRAVAFSPDGATLASAGHDGLVRLWDVATAAQTALLEGHGGEVNTVAFSPDGAALVSAGHDGLVRLWDVAAATETALLEGHGGWVNAVAFSPDGTTLASTSHDGSVRLRDVSSGTETALLQGHGGWVNAVAFSPDGATLASAADDGVVRLWDVAAATQTALLEGHSGWVHAVAFSPDEATLASAGNDRLVRLWDVAAATQDALLEGHGDTVNAVAFSAEGATLASGGSDESVRLWDVAAASQTALLEGHSGWVRAVAFSPDGTTLASAGSDQSVRLWDVATATQTALLEGHDGWVNAVAFSPDGAMLASAGDDGSVRLWDVAGAALLVSVRLGSFVGAVALRDRELAVGVGRAVAYFLITDGEQRATDTSFAGKMS
ncbi:MAG: NB-ARC domain-containing protein [Solirubrobacteraceae bacterium]